MPARSPSGSRMRRIRPVLLSAACSAGLALAVACGDGTGPGSRQPATFDMAALPDTVGVGDSLRLLPLLVVKDARGRVVTPSSVVWETTDSSVLVVEDGDRLVAVDSGNALVRASVPVPNGTISGNVRVEVRTLVRDIALAVRTDCLGINDTVSVLVVPVDGRGRLMSPARATLSSSDTLVLRVDARTRLVRASGDGTASVVAEGDGVRRELPVRVRLARLALGDDAVAQLAIGESHACAITTTRAAVCWGAGFLGQIGYGGNGSSVAPTRVAGERTWSDIDVQGSSSCGVTTDGLAWCWGEYAHGTAPHLVPVEVPLPPEAKPAAQARIGRTDALCVIGTGGGSGCWGSNNSLLLAREPAATRDMSVQPISGGRQWRTVDPGYDHACGVTNAGSLECWGILGRIIPGGQTSSTPVAVDPARRYTAVASGIDFSCALDEQGVARCFGINDMGQLGRGTTSSPVVPQPMLQVDGEARFTRIYAGDRYACGLTADGTAWCWGERARGTARALVPLVFSRVQKFATFAAGTRGACGVTAEGAVYCAPIVVPVPVR